MMNIIKRFWALCLDTHMKLALYKYAIIIMLLLIVDHSDAVGASPVGAAPTTSSFPT